MRTNAMARVGLCLLLLLSGGGSLAAPAVDDNELRIALRIEPNVPTYGRVHEAVIELENLSDRPRRVEVKAMLGEVAHFVAGSDGVAFVRPEQAEQERWLVWPEQVLLPFDRVELSFGFLVSWDVRGDVFLSVEARDVEAGEEMPLAVVHLRQPPQYPAQGDSIEFMQLFINGLIGLVIIAVLVVPVLWQRVFKRPLIVGRSTRQKLALIGALLLTIGSGSMLWSELEPRLAWKVTRCEVLDVRYSVHAETKSGGPGRQSVTRRTYYPLLALRYQAGEKLIISTGYRVHASLADPSQIGPFKRGDQVECYFDPSDPAWVVVYRDLSVFGLLFALFLGALAAGLAWYGLRRTA